MNTEVVFDTRMFELGEIRGWGYNELFARIRPDRPSSIFFNRVGPMDKFHAAWRALTKKFVGDDLSMTIAVRAGRWRAIRYDGLSVGFIGDDEYTEQEYAELFLEGWRKLLWLDAETGEPEDWIWNHSKWQAQYEAKCAVRKQERADREERRKRLFKERAPIRKEEKAQLSIDEGNIPNVYADYTNELKLEIVNLYWDGYTPREIAVKVQIPAKRIGSFVSRYKHEIFD